MTNRKTFGLVAAAVLAASLTLAGCGSSNSNSGGSSSSASAGGASPSASGAASPSASTGSSPAASGGTVKLTIGGYSILKESFGELIPIFQKEWKDKTGQTVEFEQSYQASGSQATAIIQGFEADIAPLSLEGDIQKIVDKGFITNDWKSKPHGGMITQSIAAIGVREGNPKQIKDWTDLTKPGVEVLIPNPSTSGGAKWDINGVYGAGLKMSEAAGQKDPEKAKELVAQIYKNVKVLDKSGADSLTTFDKGVGDAIITYENELLARIQKGQKYEEVIPEYTTLIENPVALVDKYVDKHGNREVAEAFLDFLWSPEAQDVLAKHGFRPVDAEVANKYADQYKTPPGLFDTSYLGGWDQVNKELYGPGGMWESVLAEGGAK